MCGRLTLKTPAQQLGQLLLPWIGRNELHNKSESSAAKSSAAEFANSKFEEPERADSELGNQSTLTSSVLPASILPADYQPRYNIAPTQSILAISNRAGKRQLSYFRWGLVPFWAKDLTIGNRMINARRETLREKRSFSGLLPRHRCLIVADGYYEWKKVAENRKQAFWISPVKDDLFLFAGLWDQNNRAAAEPLESCTVITTAAAGCLRQLHERMPVALNADAANEWLSGDLEAEQASRILQTATPDLFQPHPVSSFVNNSRNEGPECIQAIVLEEDRPLY